MLSEQVDVPEQAPLQPVNFCLSSGTAVSVTTVPAAKLTIEVEQAAPQFKLEGALVTVPVPLPDLESVKL
jgi:hypothetical protein